MLRDDPDRPHRLTIAAVRRVVQGNFAVPSPERVADLKVLDAANEHYIKTKVLWSTNNTDTTMIDMIGAWSRMTKVLHDMDDKYGERR